VRYWGHLYTNDHNAFNVTPLAILNINRESMAQYGFSPPTRIFEAAGAGACIISDSWQGLEIFLDPGKEVLVAGNGEEVAGHLGQLTRAQSRAIGFAARERILAQHTYVHRAAQLESLLGVSNS
jgi:spore maturation protein CgeB